MKQKLIETRALVVSLSSEIKELEEKIGPIIVQIGDNKNMIITKRQLLVKRKEDLIKIKENTIAKFLLSPMFNSIPFAVTIILVLLSLIFSTIVLLAAASIFGISYLCVNSIAKARLKKDIAEIILEKILPEYATCTNDIAILKDEIECLKKANEESTVVNYSDINILKNKRKKLENLVLTLLTEFFIELANADELQAKPSVSQVCEVIGSFFQLSDNELKGHSLN